MVKKDQELISEEELKRTGFNETEFERIFYEADTDVNGKISYEEFVHHMKDARVKVPGDLRWRGLGRPR